MCRFLGLDLLARIVTVRINARPLFTLDGGGRTGVLLRLFATLLIECVVDPFQCSVIEDPNKKCISNKNSM
jgi:hypothetical protein